MGGEVDGVKRWAGSKRGGHVERSQRFSDIYQHIDSCVSHNKSSKPCNILRNTNFDPANQVDKSCQTLKYDL